MHPVEHYISLRKELLRAADGTPLDITLEELSVLLRCTSRNVKLLLKRMREAGWIEWQPGRGRGISSRLTFRQPLEHMVLEYAKELVERGDVGRALHLVEELGEHAAAHTSFFAWLGEQFGHRKEQVLELQSDTLVMPVTKSVCTLDPAFTVYALDSHLARHLFDTLVRLDAASGKVLPHLAYDWEVSEDGLTWLFRLRKSVMFHHGSELTAEDVAWSLHRLADPQLHSPFAWMAREIASVEAVRRDVVRIRLLEPNRLFLRYLCSDRMSIVSREAAGSGTGPYRVVRFEPTKLVLGVHHAYFRERGLLDRIELWTVPPMQKGLGALADAMRYLPNIDKYEDAPDDWGELRDMGEDTKYIAIQCRGDALTAESEAFRKLLIRLLHSDPFWRERELAFDAVSFRYRGGRRQPIDRVSREELAATGYKGELVRIGHTCLTEMEAERIAAILEDSGVRAQLDRVEWNCAYVSPEELREYSAVISAVIVDREDPQLSLIETYETTVPLRALASDRMKAEIAARLLAIKRETCEQKRDELFIQLDEWAERAGLIGFLFHRRRRTTFHPSMRGVSLNGLGFADFSRVWFTS